MQLSQFQHTDEIAVEVTEVVSIARVALWQQQYIPSNSFFRHPMGRTQFAYSWPTLSENPPPAGRPNREVHSGCSQHVNFELRLFLPPSSVYPALSLQICHTLWTLFEIF
jgi:hypothetical protein